LSSNESIVQHFEKKNQFKELQFISVTVNNSYDYVQIEYCDSNIIAKYL